MRTTLDIDDDILALARSVSRTKDATLGAVVSEFARRGIREGALHHAVGVESDTELQRQLRALGVVPFARNPETPMVTDELVRQIRDSEGI